ncbi:MAG: rhomboid family intramembrane serine protease [Pseudopedobacter saltans]|uniref:Rhomboid family intramembrane serine protease n=1 Tax=Pseudopedobacter saltans TaxID=151895 RepID=A0A2W5EP63_9SPHI|nr:MAG: rhomboid family intramembrane serine protease [Pseudopedobacter saltans]
MTFNITLVIIVITCIVSFIGFSNRDLINKLIFYPPSIKQSNEWYRFISHGLIHADIGHLFFNMFSLYSFGGALETVLKNFFGGAGTIVYILFYVSAIVISSIPTYLKNKDNQYYMSLGASGAISAVVFAVIVIFPTIPLGILLLPFEIPAFIFGVLYVILSAYLDKKGTGNVNHSAHLYGALYGIFFIAVLCQFVHFPIFTNFILQIKAYFTSSHASNPYE